MLLAAAAGLTASPAALASSPAAREAHTSDVVASCIKASGLKNARLVGALIDYDDRAGFTAALIAGTYPQPHMRNQPGRSLCLFDRRTRRSFASPADSLR